jgi:hypothetical protein
MLKLLIATVLAQVPTTNPGLGGSLSQKGMNDAKNVLTPIIFDNLKNLTIPEVDIPNGKFKNIDVQIPQPDLKDVQLLTHHTANSIELKADNVNVHLDADFSYKVLFITATGKADIKISKIGIDMELGLKTTTGKPSYDLAPVLEALKTGVTINPDDVDIKLTGGLVTKVASALIPAIKSSLIPDIVK